MSSIATNLQELQQKIARAAEQARRAPASVQLLAVSKTFGPEAVLQAVHAGQRAFGENYLQEALEKIDAVHALAPDIALQWHFIGPIQSNKTRSIAERFDWVHSVDREKVARRLSEQRPAPLARLNICLQVNISGEASKSGLSPAELPQVAARVAGLPGLRLRGLMAIPEPTDDVARQQLAFGAVRALYDRCRADGLALDTLSMGMSGDMSAAIACGATIVRIGSAIFGHRPTPTTRS